jgi:hypothetical protein
MEINVKFVAATKNSTLSLMTIQDNLFQCFVVEDPIRTKKIKHITCIPAGRYRIVRRVASRFLDGEKGYKNRFGHIFVPEIVGVPGFSDILIHIGNTEGDTSGCLLPNYQVNFFAGTVLGSRSTDAYKDLYLLMHAAFERGEEVWITIDRGELKAAA